MTTVRKLENIIQCNIMLKMKRTKIIHHLKKYYLKKKKDLYDFSGNLQYLNLEFWQHYSICIETEEYAENYVTENYSPGSIFFEVSRAWA